MCHTRAREGAHTAFWQASLWESSECENLLTVMVLGGGGVSGLGCGFRTVVIA
jgi:hypothetical protein